MNSRTATALAGLVGSLVLSAVLWYVFESPVFFLFVPFIPFLLRGRTGGEQARPPLRECPACGFQTHDPAFDYCPRDGTKLDVDRESSRR